MKAQFTVPVSIHTFAADIRAFGLEGARRQALVEGASLEQLTEWEELLIHAPARVERDARADREARATQRNRAELTLTPKTEWLA
jgi:hypothetical protein